MGPKKLGPVFNYDPARCPCPVCKRKAGQPIKSIKRTFKSALRRASISRDFRIHDLRPIRQDLGFGSQITPFANLIEIKDG